MKKEVPPKSAIPTPKRDHEHPSHSGKPPPTPCNPGIEYLPVQTR